MIPFDYFYEIALKRKGEDALRQENLPELKERKQIAQQTDDRFLADLTRCVFRAGFVWQIIDYKWPGFEEAFSGFVPKFWQQAPPERLDALCSDERIVRNRQKIMTVPVNARMIVEVSESHGSFGRFLADWPSDQQADLLLWLKKEGARLGGMTSQHFLRRQGWDGYVLAPDVLTALRNHQLLDASPTSKKGLYQIQKVFNHWHESTGLPYAHLSRILSYTLGRS